MRKCIERREAGSRLEPLFGRICISKPTFPCGPFRRRGEHHRRSLRYWQGPDVWSCTGVKMVNIPKYARACDLDGWVLIRSVAQNPTNVCVVMYQYPSLILGTHTGLEHQTARARRAGNTREWPTTEDRRRRLTRPPYSIHNLTPV